MKDLDLGNIQTEASGLDAFLASEPSIVSPVQASAPIEKKTGSIRVASLQQLDGFHRISAETLVHKSTRDLWAVKPEGKDLVIERLFQDNGVPLKG